MTPQQQQILIMHKDYQWHCPTKELFMKDDRKRYSELRRKGYIFLNASCDMHDHKSRVFMRRLVSAPPDQLTEAPNAPIDNLVREIKRVVENRPLFIQESLL